MDLKPSEITLLNTVDESMVRYSKEADYPWTEIVRSAGPHWQGAKSIKIYTNRDSLRFKFVVLFEPTSPEEPSNGQIMLGTPLDPQPVKLEIGVTITRDFWREIRGAGNRKKQDAEKESAHDNEPIQREPLPSHKEHPTYKRLFGKPAGRLIRPIDKQTSHVFRKKKD